MMKSMSRESECSFRRLVASALILRQVSLVQIIFECGLAIIIILSVYSACSCKLFNILPTSACYRKSPAVMLIAVAHVCPHLPSGHADRRHQVLLILLQVPRVKAREAHGPCPNTVLGEVGQSM